MILLGEAERRRHGILPTAPDLSEIAGRWLLENSRLDPEGRTGWGVPIAWDAYGDGSENPPNTIYSISTAIVADALMTWMETDTAAPGAEIIRVLSGALDIFARAPTSPSGMIPYSLQPADQPYDTFNPAAYLAGQMQRFAKYADDPQTAERLRGTADATVRLLIKERRSTPSGSWWWTYSVQEEVPNDLPHALYIIEGLRTYVRENGRLASEIDMPAIVGHLDDFFDQSERPRGWPNFQDKIDRAPRLYDLGMALHFACSDPSLDRLAQRWLAVISDYRTPEGYIKYPPETDLGALVVNEYEAYLWRGLISCKSRQLSTSVLAPIERPTDPLAILSPLVTDVVPFVRVGSGSNASSVSFSHGSSSLSLPWAPGIHVTEPGFVMQAVDDGDGGALIVRGYPDNDLSITTLDKSGKKIAESRIVHTPPSAPIFRASAFHNNILHIVYYDNQKLGNYLSRYVRNQAGYIRIGTPWLLPSLEDPAGGTYEMIPGMYFVQWEDRLFLLGGTLNAEVKNDGSIAVSELPNCLRVIEAVAFSEGPVALCLQREPHGAAAPFQLLGPAGMALQSNERGVPFNLRVSEGKVRLSYAKTPSELAEMLRFDIERSNNGWLEFGTDNVEGRIPWSQLYYINGFLDFLLLAKDVPDRFAAFSEILGEIRLRLDQELQIADEHWQHGRFATRGFTVDRSPALFAVQTSRLLLAMNRYLNEVEEPRILAGYADLYRAVTSLRDHVDVLSTTGQSNWWIPDGHRYLSFGRGSAFYFDGLNVPYNHQNEWAYALIRTADVPDDNSLRSVKDIVGTFLRRIAPDGRLPAVGIWDYWWGKAFDGWIEPENVSDNLPAYAGDHLKAIISFRSIDVMSALAASALFEADLRSNLMQSAAKLITTGKLYPFVAYELRRANRLVELPDAVIRSYIRVSSPWELQNAAWAYDAALRR